MPESQEGTAMLLLYTIVGGIGLAAVLTFSLSRVLFRANEHENTISKDHHRGVPAGFH
jgi:hypothetical protein